MFKVESRTIDNEVTALGRAGPHTLVIDRPTETGGGGRAFNGGGHLLHLAIAGCISNDRTHRDQAAYWPGDTDPSPQERPLP